MPRNALSEGSYGHASDLSERPQGAAAALADEGRIPIFKPTTITQSGSYVLTRDITVASGAIITVQASDVTLDLNGKTLQMTNPTDALIFLDTQTSTFRTQSLIEGNQIQGNFGCGIVFVGAGPANNAYRNNMLRGNGGGTVCNTGVGNTDAGGNILWSRPGRNQAATGGRRAAVRPAARASEPRFTRRPAARRK